MVVDGLSVFGAILAVVQLIGTLAAKVFNRHSQGKHKCLELAERVEGLAGLLRGFPHAAASDKDTAGVLQRLKRALDEAFTLIKCCEEGSIHCYGKATELDKVDRRITNFMLELVIVRQLSPHHHQGSTSQAPYYQPPCVGWPSATHAEEAVENHLRAEEEAAVNRVLEESSAAAHAEEEAVENHLRAEEEAAVNRVLQESLALTLTDEEEEAVENHLRAEEQAAVNRVLEESRAAAHVEEAVENHLRAEEEAAVNRMLHESLALTLTVEVAVVNHHPEEEPLALTLTEEEAVVNRVVEESLALARAEDEATVNRMLQESLALTLIEEEDDIVNHHPAEEDTLASMLADEEAVVDRVVEDSLALARTEEAVVNRVVEESIASALADGMMRALCVVVDREDNIFPREGYN